MSNARPRREGPGGLTEKKRLLDHVNVYFNETQAGRYVPRAVLMDLEPSVIDSVRGSKYGKLYKPDNCIKGTSGAGNNGAKVRSPGPGARRERHRD